MGVICKSRPDFHKSNRIIAIANHPPEVKAGDKGVIITPRVGRIYAVRLSNGEVHQWLARPELRALRRGSLKPGDKARIITSKGHPLQVRVGEIVTILRVIYTPYYDLYIRKKYHRWLADFEVAGPKH